MDNRAGPLTGHNVSFTKLSLLTMPQSTKAMTKSEFADLQYVRAKRTWEDLR